MKKNILLLINRPFTWNLRRTLFRDSAIKQWNQNGHPLPPPHYIKQNLVNDFATVFGYTVFIETGTYLGRMVYAMMNRFPKIYTIELSKELQNRAAKLFRDRPHIKCLWGDSGKVMKDLMPEIKEGAIFWLDGHYSSGITAMGETICPVLNELRAISSYDKYNHIILIDDARLFLTGDQQYPLYTDLVTFVKNLDEAYNIYLFKTDTIVVTKINLNDYPNFDHYLQSL